MWKPAAPLPVAPHERALLEALVRGRTTPQKVALRARIVLGAAEGQSNAHLAKQLRVTRPTVLVWRTRYARTGVAGLVKDAPRPGRRKRIAAQQVAAIVTATLHTTPRDATHWSTRSMARAQGVSEATVRHLARARPATASDRDLQAESGSRLRPQTAGCGRAVPQSSR
jgi:transposase